MPVQNARKILTQSLQRLGYALLLPVSILPLAALLHRLGQPDVLDLAVLSLAGRALFSQMPLIYAVAIAFGLSRQGQGAQALAGAVNFLLLSSALGTLAPGLHSDMICGLLAGLTTAIVYPWLKRHPMPHWLRLVNGDFTSLLASALTCLLLAFPLAALLIGFLARAIVSRNQKSTGVRWALLFLAGLAGSFAFVHPMGIAGIAINAGIPVDQAFLADIVYWPGDVIKNIAASVVAVAVHRAFPGLLVHPAVERAQAQEPVPAR